MNRIPSWRFNDDRSTFPPPPNAMAAPSTSSAVETIEPAIVPRTTFGRLSEIANNAIRSSGALPKLALRKPPTLDPVCSAMCSVASPIR